MRISEAIKLDHADIDWPAFGHESRAGVIPLGTRPAIARCGFEIERCERLMFAASRLEPRIPYASATLA